MTDQELWWVVIGIIAFAYGFYQVLAFVKRILGGK